jgi:transcriptional regulator with XRE-family HTH domain
MLALEMVIQVEILSNAQIGYSVRSARRAVGWSSKQLAEKCGLSPTALCKIESGKQSISFGETIALCAALGIQIDSLASLARRLKPIAHRIVTIKVRLGRELQALEKRTIMPIGVKPPKVKKK